MGKGGKCQGREEKKNISTKKLVGLSCLLYSDPQEERRTNAKPMLTETEAIVLMCSYLLSGFALSFPGLAMPVSYACQSLRKVKGMPRLWCTSWVKTAKGNKCLLPTEAVVC